MTGIRKVCLACAVAVSLFTSGRGVTAAETSVAAATDLNFALPVLEKAFEASGGEPVKLTFGSSGQLAAQIANGAPFDLFLSADEKFVEDLNGKGLTKDDGHLYALGHLAVYAPSNSKIKADAKLEGLTAALTSGQLKKLSIANPEIAPYGRVAKAALEKLNLWDQAQGILVRGDSASQALQFAETGAADLALVPASLIEPAEAARKGSHARVDKSIAPELRQRLVVLKTGSANAEAFAKFIMSADGQAILAKYGFSLPDAP